MNDIIISSGLIKEPLSLRPNSMVQISIVAYEHQAGIPARFCAGLLPAIKLAKKLDSHGIQSVIRLLDPSPIANYCNGWEIKQPRFRDIIAEFLQNSGVGFFFDEAEQISNDGLELLRALGSELEASTDENVMGVVQRIQESGRKHGGDSGASNALLYMAAHPFSWLDMYHPSIWKRRYPNGHQFVNLMSKSEERFSVIRKFLQNRRPDLSTNISPTDKYVTVCSTPCYIPLDGEPMFEDLTNHGYDWCYDRYREIKKRNSNYERVYKDFRLLMSFLR
ncbi:MAG: hypothetical protein Q7K44_00515 [Candidatus Liptonbacteria bacterium]|nr:hypothetical protein [Candidatus Liptonbacteria bacterium]